MAQARGRRFTIYDMMEDKGVFDSNPANINARDGTGLSIHQKAIYPMMLYHPEGEEKQTVAPTAIATPFGPQWVGEQKELISKIAKDEAEANALLAEGWHKLPGSAIAARYRKAGLEPPVMAASPIDAARMAQEDEAAALRKQIAELTAKNAETEQALEAALKSKK